MASSAFKQECPSCEAQVPIRDESMVGKKVACPKCKYPFVVQKPKKAAGDEDAPEGKGKADKAGKGAAPEDAAAPSKAKNSKKKMFIGLGLAGVGLIILAAASFIIMGRTGGGGGSNVAKNPPPKFNPNPPKDDEPEDDKKDKESKENDPTVEKPVTAKKVEPVVTADGRILNPPGPELTNLLPPDTEHVFHGYFKDLFDFASPFRAAVFGETGTFMDQDMVGRIGFPPSAVDDLIRAESFSKPWSYTVVHLRRFVDPEAVTKALDLKAMPAIGGHVYHQAQRRNAWIEQLGRVSAGAPHLPPGVPGDSVRPLFVFFHDPQTMIFADEAPLQALLRNNRRFPPRSLDVEPAPRATVADVSVADSIWEGSETRPGGQPAKLKFSFPSDESVELETSSSEGSISGTVAIKGNDVTLTFGETLKYTAKVAGMGLAGQGFMDKAAWKFAAKRSKGPAVAKAAGQPTLEVRSGIYLTIDPALKGVLDRIEALNAETEEKVLYSTATMFDAARVTKLPTELKGRQFIRRRQVWDLTALFDDRKPPRVKIAGSALIERDRAAKSYQHRTEFECPQEHDARDLLKVASNDFAPEIARWVDRVIGHKLWTPQAEALEPPPVVVDENTGEVKEYSRWSADQRDNSVDVVINLILNDAALRRIHVLGVLLSLNSRAEVDLDAQADLRHRLARAGKQLGEQGIGNRKIPAGTYPPGAFPRASSSGRSTDSPYFRMSWMTALLPFIGHDNLARRLSPELSWRDPGNWLPARVVVPEFQDPSYPASARYVAIPGMGVDPAATHVVGIAGVGLDAGDYDRNDPALVAKRGVFGYDASAAIADIQKGRGLAQTILMIQIPHDGLTGVSPWVAGGGSTLRGVPEKNSIAPFVLSTDRNGKPITHQGRQGTYAAMTDGSVRFLDKNIPDEVFKAMCTVQGPAPEKADFFKDAFPVCDPTAPPPPPPAPVTKEKAPEARTKEELAPLPAKVGPAVEAKKK